jgi:hypothetical protein
MHLNKETRLKGQLFHVIPLLYWTKLKAKTKTVFVAQLRLFIPVCSLYTVQVIVVTA